MLLTALDRGCGYGIAGAPYRGTANTASPISEVIVALRKTGLEDILHAVQTDHRTNQQLFAHVIFAVVKQRADNYADGNYDLRNEACCFLADSMMKGAKETYDRYSVEEDLHLPYI